MPFKIKESKRVINNKDKLFDHSDEEEGVTVKEEGVTVEGVTLSSDLDISTFTSEVVTSSTASPTEGESSVVEQEILEEGKKLVKWKKSRISLIIL